MFLNNVYLEPNNINSQHYKLLLINDIVFNIKKLNENNSIKDNVNNVNINLNNSALIQNIISNLEYFQIS